MVSECAKADPSMRGELDKYTVDLLSEELKLQSAVADESQQRADAALLEAKKLSSQYQKEAEKCNFGMETCEEAREKAEEALTEQKKISKMWEQRARDHGWTGEWRGFQQTWINFKGLHIADNRDASGMRKVPFFAMKMCR